MLLRAAKNNGLVGVALVLGDLAVVPGSFFGLAFCLPIDSLCLSSRLLWLLWQDSRAMYPLFADCTKKGGLPGSVCAKCMLFALKLAGSSSHVSVSGCNRAISDT